MRNESTLKAFKMNNGWSSITNVALNLSVAQQCTTECVCVCVCLSVYTLQKRAPRTVDDHIHLHFTGVIISIFLLFAHYSLPSI